MTPFGLTGGDQYTVALVGVAWYPKDRTLSDSTVEKKSQIL